VLLLFYSIMFLSGADAGNFMKNVYLIKRSFERC